MIEKNTQEFIADAEKLLVGAVADDEFVKIKTRAGNAILISEAEWNILRDAMQMVLALAVNGK